MAIVYLTRQGLAKLEAELRKYEKVVRPQAAMKIEEARKHGDLSENAEYDAAKEELARIDYHINLLRRKLSNVQIVEAKDIGVDKVYLLNQVDLMDMNSGKKFTYVLVSPEEVDIKKGHISVQSPVGKALLGKSEGDIVNFKVPAGEKKWKIVKINPLK